MASPVCNKLATHGNSRQERTETTRGTDRHWCGSKCWCCRWRCWGYGWRWRWKWSCRCPLSMDPRPLLCRSVRLDLSADYPTYPELEAEDASGCRSAWMGFSNATTSYANWLKGGRNDPQLECCASPVACCNYTAPRHAIRGREADCRVSRAPKRPRV